MLVMMNLAPMLLALAQTPAQPPVQAIEYRTDTTFDVRPEARLEVNNYGGEIVVKTWERKQVRVRADHGRRDSLRIGISESVVELRTRSRFGPGGPVDYEITIPATMAVSLKGTYTDMTVDGTRAKVTASTVKGDVTVRGGAELVNVRSVEGHVDVSGTRGRVEAHGVNESVRVANVTGDVAAESISGPIVIIGVDASIVEAGTVNGLVYYDGVLKAGGLYSFVSHDGSVTVSVPDPPNLTLSIATMEGSFRSSFPMQLPASEGSRRRRQQITLGNGSARVEMESFSGSLRLVKRGEVPPPTLRRKD
jgi:DUF4097 and DUF4098 domain-containing protein YvlB